MNIKLLRIPFFFSYALLIGTQNTVIHCSFWDFSEKNYHIPALVTGTAALFGINYGLGRYNDVRINSMIKAKETELNQKKAELNSVISVLNNSWENNLSTQYNNIDYTLADVSLEKIPEINNPKEISNLSIKIKSHIWLRNLRNFFNEKIMIDSNHTKAKTVNKLNNIPGKINHYNQSYSQYLNSIKRYLTFMKLHNTYCPIFNTHRSSMKQYVNTQNPRSSFTDYSDLFQANQPEQGMPFLSGNMEIKLIAECTDANADYPYVSAAAALGNEISTINKALETFKKDLSNNDNQTLSNLMQNKISEGSDYLSQMNVLLKRDPLYLIQLKTLNQKRRADQEISLQQQHVENEKIKALAQKEMAATNRIAKEAEAKKLEEEAKYTKSQNQAFRKQNNFPKDTCETQ